MHTKSDVSDKITRMKFTSTRVLEERAEMDRKVMTSSLFYSRTRTHSHHTHTFTHIHTLVRAPLLFILFSNVLRP